MQVYQRTTICFTILLAALLATTQVRAQQDPHFVVHFDKPFYVTGEIAWFTLYLPIDFKDRHVAFSTRVVNALGQEQDRFFLRNDGQTSIHGYYKIPFDAETSMYEFQFVASEGAAIAEQDLASFHIPVYSDLRPLPGGAGSGSAGSVHEVALPDMPLHVQIKQSEGAVHCRDEVALHVTVQDPHGQPVRCQLSVSVTDASLVNAGTSIYPSIQGTEMRRIYVPNLKNDLYVRGDLLDATNRPLQVNVLGGYAAQDDQFHFSKSNEKGRFHMVIPDFAGAKSVQFVGYYKEVLDIHALVDIAQPKRPAAAVPVTDEVRSYLDLSLMRKKIFQQYQTFESPLEMEAFEPKPKFLRPNITYKVKEYESFPDVKGFFGELLTTLSFKMDKDSIYSATLYNPDGRIGKNTHLRGLPLFIIDGKVTRDADFIARLPMAPIEDVSLFNNPKQLAAHYSAMGTSGVVKIRTSLINVQVPEGDARNFHTVYGLQPVAEFPTFDPATLEGGHQPFFRPQLYWNPAVSSDVRGNVHVTFHQSDDIGDFQVEVLVQAEDGRMGRGTYTYHVSY